MSKKKKIVIIVCSIIAFIALALSILTIYANHEIDKMKKKSQESLDNTQGIMSYSDCQDISLLIENAIEHDPDTSVSVYSVDDKVTVSCNIDPIVLGYQVIPVANGTVPIIKEHLLDKNIPFEFIVGGMFYKNGEVSSIIRIETDDLESWDIEDLSDPDHVFIRSDISFQEIYDHLNK